MAKRSNNRIKKQPEKQPEQIAAQEGNTGTLTVVLLNQILAELKELNGRLKQEIG
jgi:hypothetical protein